MVKEYLKEKADSLTAEKERLTAQKERLDGIRERLHKSIDEKFNSFAIPALDVT